MILVTAKEIRSALSAATKAHAAIEKAAMAAKGEAVCDILSELESAAHTACAELQELLDDCED